jgi:hypothetical protein
VKQHDDDNHDDDRDDDCPRRAAAAVVGRFGVAVMCGQGFVHVACLLVS